MKMDMMKARRRAGAMIIAGAMILTVDVVSVAPFLLYGQVLDAVIASIPPVIVASLLIATGVVINKKFGC